MAWLRLISVALGQPFLTPVGCFCVASLVSGSPHCSGRAAALVDKTRRDGPRSHLSTMLRTFSGRQPHPAAAEAPQPGSDPAAAGAVAPPPLPEFAAVPGRDAVPGRWLSLDGTAAGRRPSRRARPRGRRSSRRWRPRRRPSGPRPRRPSSAGHDARPTATWRRTPRTTRTPTTTN